MAMVPVVPSVVAPPVAPVALPLAPGVAVAAPMAPMAPMAVPPPPPAVPDTADVCRSFQRTGKCFNITTCIYSHPLPPIPDNLTPFISDHNICAYWFARGVCPNESTCPANHPPIDVLTQMFQATIAHQLALQQHHHHQQQQHQQQQLHAAHAAQAAAHYHLQQQQQQQQHMQQPPQVHPIEQQQQQQQMQMPQQLSQQLPNNSDELAALHNQENEHGGQHGNKARESELSTQQQHKSGAPSDPVAGVAVESESQAGTDKRTAFHSARSRGPTSSQGPGPSGAPLGAQHNMRHAPHPNYVGGTNQPQQFQFAPQHMVPQPQHPMYHRQPHQSHQPHAQPPQQIQHQLPHHHYQQQQQQQQQRPHPQQHHHQHHHHQQPQVQMQHQLPQQQQQMHGGYAGQEAPRSPTPSMSLEQAVAAATPQRSPPSSSGTRADVSNSPTMPYPSAGLPPNAGATNTGTNSKAFAKSPATPPHNSNSLNSSTSSIENSPTASNVSPATAEQQQQQQQTQQQQQQQRFQTSTAKPSTSTMVPSGVSNKLDSTTGGQVRPATHRGGVRGRGARGRGGQVPRSGTASGNSGNSGNSTASSNTGRTVFTGNTGSSTGSTGKSGNSRPSRSQRGRRSPATNSRRLNGRGGAAAQPKSKRPRKRVECREWPNCRYGSNCYFVHPTSSSTSRATGDSGKRLPRA